MARGENIAPLDEVQQPHAALRWVDQWDNLNGSIERGYAGPSIFFEKGSVRADLTRAGEYARLLASVGINGCTINNVNADPRIIDDSFIPQLARVAMRFVPGAYNSRCLSIWAAPRFQEISTALIRWIPE